REYQGSTLSSRHPAATPCTHVLWAGAAVEDAFCLHKDDRIFLELLTGVAGLKKAKSVWSEASILRNNAKFATSITTPCTHVLWARKVQVFVYYMILLYNIL
ncbi:hypothetical protein P4U44_08410, partial [Alkalihalobacillus alcalophilus]|uniref:hypothetical protein n=1 Tax=Alkalihalobacillus alcalophilus TaxID=1445 RepID=UPI002E1C564A|nr:hypothetical protein [Alkalihalobacillus alcalophilus]